MEVSVTQEAALKPPVQRDWPLLLLLLVLAGGLRTWVVYRTEVISRDSIVFIDYALQFERRPWTDVLRDNHQHPGYPLALLAVSLPIRSLLGTDCWTMQLSAQLAASLAGWLLVLPMFYLGKALFDRGVGFWATLLFQCLPVSGRILSEALSEPLFLLLVTSALLWAVRGLQSGSVGRWAGCGVFTGMAYLTRPEGAVVAVAGTLILVLVARIPGWRRGWAWTCRRGAALAVCALILAGPYVVIIHHVTNKPSEGVIKTRLRAQAAPGRPNPVTAGRPIGQPGLLAVWVDPKGAYPRRLARGLWAVANELLKGFQYVAWLPALAGLAWGWKIRRLRPETWFLLIVSVLHTLILWRLAMVAGYVSERHVLLLVLCGTFPAAAGLRELPQRLARRRPVSASEHGRWRAFSNASAWSVALLLALPAVGLPKMLQPIHANRIGHREVGRWLAANIESTAEIHDGHFGWAHYYAGRLSIHGQPFVPAPDGSRIHYIVKGRSRERENPYGPTNAQADFTVESIRDAHGEIVYHWPENVLPEEADAVVWKVKLPAEPLGGSRK
jgi:hypothetical protein